MEGLSSCDLVPSAWWPLRFNSPFRARIIADCGVRFAPVSNMKNQEDPWRKLWLEELKKAAAEGSAARFEGARKRHVKAVWIITNYPSRGAGFGPGGGISGAFRRCEIGLLCEVFNYLNLGVGDHEKVDPAREKLLRAGVEMMVRDGWRERLREAIASMP